MGHLQAYSLAFLSLAAAAPAADMPTHEICSDGEAALAASECFSTGAKDLSAVLAKVLEMGHPVAIIRGEKAVGDRHWNALRSRRNSFKATSAVHVYGQGASIGFDVGANAVETFILVYDLPNRFPRVEGSLYFVGGLGVNYMQRDGVAIAPASASVGAWYCTQLGQFIAREAV